MCKESIFWDSYGELVTNLNNPDSEIRVANMGPTRGRQGSHFGTPVKLVTYY